MAFKSIVYLLMPKHLYNSMTNFFENLLEKSKYLVKILIFLINNKAVWTFYDVWIDVFNPELR